MLGARRSSPTQCHRCREDRTVKSAHLAANSSLCRLIGRTPLSAHLRHNCSGRTPFSGEEGTRLQRRTALNAGVVVPHGIRAHRTGPDARRVARPGAPTARLYAQRIPLGTRPNRRPRIRTQTRPQRQGGFDRVSKDAVIRSKLTSKLVAKKTKIGLSTVARPKNQNKPETANKKAAGNRGTSFPGGWSEFVMRRPFFDSTTDRELWF